LSCGLFGLNVMTRFLTKSGGMNLNLRTLWQSRLGKKKKKKNLKHIEKCHLAKACDLVIIRVALIFPTAIKGLIEVLAYVSREFDSFWGWGDLVMPPWTCGFLKLEDYGQVNVLLWRLAVHALPRGSI
jgi:hypothetical protein